MRTTIGPRGSRIGTTLTLAVMSAWASGCSSGGPSTPNASTPGAPSPGRSVDPAPVAHETGVGVGVGAWEFDQARVRSALIEQMKREGRLPPEAGADHPAVRDVLERLSASTFLLTVRGDGTFSALVSGGGSTSEAEGVWSRSGDVLRLRTLRENGREVSTGQDLLLKPTGDGAAELGSESPGGPPPVSLRRRAS